MALTIKKSWYDKLVPLSSEERAQILDDVMMYYFTDNPGEYNHEVKDFIVADIDKKKAPKVEPRWRTDFIAYKTEMNTELQQLLNNTMWLAQQAKFYPNIDIRLTLQKSATDYWGTDRGWQNKKKSRILKIDWKATFTNALGNKWNHVYLQRGTQNKGEVRVVWEFDGARRTTNRKAYEEDLRGFGKDRVKFIREELV